MEGVLAMSCRYEKSDGVMETLHRLQTDFAQVYQSPEAIAEFAVALKEQRQAEFCQLPFCHTVEAEAMGAEILLGDQIAGARAGRLIFNSLEEICIRKIDYSGSRISNMLAACKILKSHGETVVFSISGPFSIVSCLIDITKLFKAWRKANPTVDELFAHISTEQQIFVEKICAAGADYISYADPVGVPGIIGPKYAQKAALIFTLPFLTKACELCKGRANIYLCPMTAGALKAFGYADFRDEIIHLCSGVIIPRCVKSTDKKQFQLEILA